MEAGTRGEGGAWHGLMMVCYEPKHGINSTLHPRSRGKKISEYLMLFDALLFVRVKTEMTFSV